MAILANGLGAWSGDDVTGARGGPVARGVSVDMVRDGGTLGWRDALLRVEVFSLLVWRL